jgi:tetratricopeptide (TPR) repeat protein
MEILTFNTMKIKRKSRSNKMCCSRILIGAGLFLISAVFSSSHAQDPAILQDAFSKSHNYEARGNFTDAVLTLKKIYAEDSYEINLRLGWVTYLAGFFTESVGYYQKANNLKPYALEPKFGLVYPLASLGNWDQVIMQYNEILKIDPQNTTANYRMGSIYYERRDFAKAEKFLEKVVNLYPFDHDSLLLFAWTNLKLGRFREAQVLFNKVLLNKPHDSSALEGLSLIK